MRTRCAGKAPVFKSTTCSGSDNAAIVAANPSAPCAPMLQPFPLPKARLEALTDGIFAVTMTLLVLDLKLAGPRQRRSGSRRARPPRAAAVHRRLRDQLRRAVRVLARPPAPHAAAARGRRDLRVAQPRLPAVHDVRAAVDLVRSGIAGAAARRHPLRRQPDPDPRLRDAHVARMPAATSSTRRVTDAHALWRSVRRRFLGAAAVIVAGIVAALIEIAVRRRMSATRRTSTCC